jgi:hypothetical protein
LLPLLVHYKSQLQAHLVLRLHARGRPKNDWLGPRDKLLNIVTKLEAGELPAGLEVTELPDQLRTLVERLLESGVQPQGLTVPEPLTDEAALQAARTPEVAGRLARACHPPQGRQVVCDTSLHTPAC